MNTLGLLSAGAGDAVKTALTEGFNGVQTSALEYVAIGLGVGIAILGVKMAVKIGIQFFKSIASK